VFTVLAFGLSSTGYIFTKVVRNLTLLAVGKIISINSIKFVIFAVGNFNSQYFKSHVKPNHTKLHNINSLKPLPILRLNTDFKVFAVASNIGAAGYVHGYDLIMHKHWASNEAMKRPTWRTLPIAGVKEIILPHNLADNRILTLLAVGKIISINSIKFVIFAVACVKTELKLQFI
jgi:hypothetical protein